MIVVLSIDNYDLLKDIFILINNTLIREGIIAPILNIIDIKTTTMTSLMTTTQIGIIVIVICSMCIAGVILIERKNKKEREARIAEILAHQQALKAVYTEALRSTDKKLALDAGRAYYSSLRGGKLTIYDEQAINNDLLTME